MLQVKIYSGALIAFSVFAFALAYWFFKALPANPKRWEVLPRAVFLGALLAALDLGWVVPQSEPVVPASMTRLVLPLAVVAFIACYMFLDYLFSRAFGGALILLAHYFLQASFAYDVPARPVIAALCLAMGTLGIFFCGKPHLMRDMIRGAAAAPRWRVAAGVLSIVYAVVFLSTGIVALSR